MANTNLRTCIKYWSQDQYWDDDKYEHKNHKLSIIGLETIHFENRCKKDFLDKQISYLRQIPLSYLWTVHENHIF